MASHGNRASITLRIMAQTNALTGRDSSGYHATTGGSKSIGHSVRRCGGYGDKPAADGATQGSSTSQRNPRFATAALRPHFNLMLMSLTISNYNRKTNRIQFGMLIAIISGW
jgi:hypothetical protein